MARRKTYRTKKAALKAARGKEVYHVKGPPRGWRVSGGRKYRGKRGRKMRARKAARRRKKKRRKRKKIKIIKIRLGNPNPEICGYE